MDRIQSLEDIHRYLDRLMKLDERLIAIRIVTGDLPLRLSRPDFSGLADIVVSQHISKASAAAIMGRLTEVVDPLSAQEMNSTRDETLVEVGLTDAKLRTLRGLALAIERGDLDLSAICKLPAIEAIEALTAFKGIGPWTAEVFLLFCAGHVDIFPAGDVALRTAIGNAFMIEPRPSIGEARAISEQWAPYRGIAARLLWGYYAVR